MATKKLSKTAIEGGRSNFNKWKRRNSHNEERAAERDYCQRVMRDPECADEDFIEPKQKVWKEFSDKLSPIERWIESQVGRPWNEVRSEIFQKFDTRTTAGRHITFDHLLASIVEADHGFDKYGCLVDPDENDIIGKSYYRHHSFYVDKNGILQGKKYNPPKYISLKPEIYEVAEKFLDNRIIMEKGGKLYWILPTEGIWRASWKELDKPSSSNALNYPIKLKYYLLKNGLYKKYEYDYFIGAAGYSHGDHWEAVENPFSFRQRGELSEKEFKTFKLFPEPIKSDILKYGNGRY